MISVDCKSITLTGVDLASFANLQSATLTIATGCCCPSDSDITLTLTGATPDVEVNNNTVILNSIILGQTSEAEGQKVIKDGVYRLNLVVTYQETIGTNIQYSEEVCAFADCGVQCCIAQALVNAKVPQDVKDEIVVLYDSIGYLAKCGKCCSACSQLELLNKKLNQKFSCGCI